MWYPQNKQELESFIDNSFKQKTNIKPKKINGLIVPHAGYEYSGTIAGKAFSLLKQRKINKAIIIGPSHYLSLSKAVTSNLNEWQTPSGIIKLFNKDFEKTNIEQEHSIKNQVPFLQKLGVKEIMPLMIGEISDKQAQEIAKEISKIPAIYIFSTDLSHFLNYNEAKFTDTESIDIIKNLKYELINHIEACGIYPLKILFHLCKILNTKPNLIEYKNSGDITGDKSSVVGYASFYF